MTTDPARALEVERKYDADADTPLPRWEGVAQVSPVEIHHLDAVYFDTADFALARAGVALRRRTGGTDAGWHIKGPRQGDARLELSWPLGATSEVPPEVMAVVAEWTSSPLTPLARIESTRHALALSDGGGALLAEFVDDHVVAQDLRRGATRSWREWELELAPAASSDAADQEVIFTRLEKAIFAAGGRVSASDSKLARALGH